MVEHVDKILNEQDQQEELIIEEEDYLPVSGNVDQGEITEEEQRKALKKLK